MISEYIIIFIVAILISLGMYLVHLKDVNNDLRRKNNNLKVKIMKKENDIKINNFEKVQLKKKNKIKEHLNDKNKSSDINISIGSHRYQF